LSVITGQIERINVKTQISGLLRAKVEVCVKSTERSTAQVKSTERSIAQVKSTERSTAPQARTISTSKLDVTKHE
jgi:hypothetical protein